ncbi:hypothetical protein Tco_0157887 [Tanacetum coccineum]
MKQNLRTRILMNSGGQRGSRGNTVMPKNSTTKMELQEKKHTLIEAARTMLVESFIFYLTLFRLKQQTHPAVNKQMKEKSKREEQVFMDELERLKKQEKEAYEEAETLRKTFETLFIQEGAAKPSSTNIFSTVSTPAKASMADFTNLETVVNVSPIPTSRIHSTHPKALILGDPNSAVQTRSKVNKSSGAHAFVDAMQEELLQFEIQKVWVLVDLPYGKKAIGTKWVYPQKERIKRRLFVRNKARMFTSALFLKGKIDEEVYVSQPPEENIDKTLILKKDKLDTHTSSSKSLYEFNGRVTFYLGLQVKQKEDGIFISQEVCCQILKNFDFAKFNTRYTTNFETQKPLNQGMRKPIDVDDHTLIGQPKPGSLGILRSVFLDLESTHNSDYAGANLDSTMAILDSCPKHNMVAYLEKSEGNVEFHEIIDFLTESSHSQCSHFVYLRGINKNDLFLDDADGIDHYLTGYIDAITANGSKSTSWDQIPTNIAIAVICLTSNQKYNFSKLIFDVFFSFMVKKGKHFSGKVTPLFATMLVQPTQDEGASSERPSEALPTPSPAPTSEVPLEPQPDSSPAQTSEVPIKHQPSPSPRPSPTTTIPDSIPETSGENLGGHSSSDKSLSGNEGDMTIQGVYDLCLSLCKQVSDQAKEIQALKAQITKLKKQAKPVIKHHKAYLKSVSLKQRFPRKSFSKKHRVHKESVFKQGRKFAKGESSVQRDPLFDIMPEDTIDHMETENAQSEGRTREMVDEDKEIDERILSTEVVLSTDKEGVSTDFEKVSTDRPIVSTDGSKKFKQLESDEEMARKMQEEWEEEEEEERSRIAEEKAANEALIRNFDDIRRQE